MSTQRIRPTKSPATWVFVACLLPVLALGLLSGTSGAAGASTASKVAQAKKGLFVLSNMPKGWKQEKGSTVTEGSNNNFPGSSQLAHCIGVPVSLIKANPPSATSPYYENQSETQEVQNNVTIFPSTSNARANYAAMANPKTPSCLVPIFQADFKKQFANSGEGTSAGTVTVTALAPAEFPKGTVGFTVNLPVTEKGVVVSSHFTSVFSIHGTVGQEIDLNGYGSTFPKALAAHLVSVAITLP
jgi:hypothetical protein